MQIRRLIQNARSFVRKCSTSTDSGAASCFGGVHCAPEYTSLPGSLADKRRDVQADVLYVVGGLYGNEQALTVIEDGVRAEAVQVAAAGGTLAVCFNADFNFFNADEKSWTATNTRIHDFGTATDSNAVATAGNVEIEVARDFELTTQSAGCGCAYPAYVPANFSDRAGVIVQQLRDAAMEAHGAAAGSWIIGWLRSLSTSQTYSVDGHRVACIHGDPTCVNGWALAAEHVPDCRGGGTGTRSPATDVADVSRWFAEADATVFAATHTCVPFLQQFGDRVLANNGSAGMANFSGDTSGIVTRIAAPGMPPSFGVPRYGATLRGGTTVSAISIAFDAATYLAVFDNTWAVGSAAAVSYRDRLADGLPHWTPTQADRTARL